MASRIAGRAAVMDGDMLKIGSVAICIHGINAPELGQICGKNARRQLLRRAAAWLAVAYGGGANPLSPGHQGFAAGSCSRIRRST